MAAPLLFLSSSEEQGLGEKARVEGRLKGGAGVRQNFGALGEGQSMSDVCVGLALRCPDACRRQDLVTISWCIVWTVCKEHGGTFVCLAFTWLASLDWGTPVLVVMVMGLGRPCQVRAAFLCLGQTPLWFGSSWPYDLSLHLTQPGLTHL